jgi:catechol 2,3-dioxygenase-like lactoylglutathione lyase family enzyme
MKIKESCVNISVKDLDRSISFYESIGLVLKSRWGNFYAMVAAPGILIGLHPSADVSLPCNSGNMSIGFTAENLQETKSELQKLSIAISERHEEGGKFIHFTDPDGTALYFIEPNW